jgi:YcaO-like protein with predicted kinase domain
MTLDARGLAEINGAASKGFVRGTHRLVSPVETLERVRHLFPVMGITRIANITGLDSIGVPVVAVYRPNSRSLAVSQGKGLDLAAAKVSAVMESIELYHAERVHLPVRLASYDEMCATDRVVNIADMPRTRTSRFHPHLPLAWIEGRDLIKDELVWLPFEAVHANYTLPLPPGAGSFPMTSNGLSSGNHHLEALSQAICEVVERDATTLWSLLAPEERAETRLDLALVDDPACCEVLERFARARIETAVWDTTTDVGIPAFFCLITERTPDPLRLLYSANGMGCHPAREVALLRALTEAAQCRATYISGARDDLYRSSFERYRCPDLLRRQCALVADGPRPRRFADIQTFAAATFAEDVAWELQRLAAVGIREVVAVDLTRPEFAVPVVRVVIPGLEGPEERIPGYVYGPRALARASSVRAGSVSAGEAHSTTATT